MNTKQSEIHALILSARQGDEHALGQLLESHRDWLRIFASRKIDTKLQGRFDASDIVQHTFQSAIHGFQNFQGSSLEELQAWLRQIHERNIKDEIREHLLAEKRTVRVETAAVGEHQFVENSWRSPSRSVLFGEDAAQLAKALAELPTDQQEAIRLRYFDELPLRELEQRMGRSKLACAGLLKRGLRKLRVLLRDV